MNKILHVPSIELDSLSHSAIKSALLNHGATATVNTVNWVDYPYCPTVNLTAAHTQSHLFIGFSVIEKHVLGRYVNDFDNVWEDSCAEIFIDDTDGKHYYNFETNCLGTMLASRRSGRSTADFLPAGTMEQIIRFASLPHSPIDKKDNNEEWNLTIGIPFSAIGLDSCPKELRANFYKCGDATQQPHFLSWSAIDAPNPDFHLPKFFGTLILD